MTLWSAVSTSLLPVLMEASIRSIVLAILISSLLRALRVKSSASRLLAWTILLYGALLMPALDQYAPKVLVEVGRINIPRPIRTIVGEPVRDVVPAHASLPVAMPSSGKIEPSPPVPNGVDWRQWCAAFYGVICFALLGRLLAGAVLTRRVLRRSRCLQDSLILDLLSELRTGALIEGQLEIAESGSVLVPITLGVVKPRIILPAAWRSWSGQTLRFVLAHELSHVSRGDYLSRMLSLVHCAIFWFSPLSWWLHRHLSEMAELASDETALNGSSDTTAYAEMVLSFFQLVETRRGRVFWMGIAMARPSRARRRFEGILNLGRERPAKLSGPVSTLLASLVLGMLGLASSISPVFSRDASPERTAVRRAATPMYSPDYIQIVQAARNLEIGDVAKLERLVDAAPEDLSARLRLLVVYSAYRNEVPSGGAKRAGQVLWLIQHHPDAEVLGSPFATFPSDREELTPEEYRQAVAAWKQALESAGQRKGRIAWNASQFVKHRDRRAYEEYLRMATESEPSNAAWGTELGLHYADSIVAARRNAAGPVADRTVAADALRRLDATKNAAVLAGATRVFQSAANKVLAIEGRPDQEYAQIAQRYFQRAQELDPQVDQDWALPQLPAGLIAAFSPQRPQGNSRSSEPAPIRKASPSEFSMLPARLRDKLNAEGCLIPQPPVDGARLALKNVIRGEFQRPGQFDWAVVCNYANGTEAIIVFWAGSDGHVSVASRSPVNQSGCWTEINAVGAGLIMKNYRAYGGLKPPPLDHQGIDAGICQKASVTHYFHKSQWLRLQGSD
jgi:hypothetical protein